MANENGEWIMHGMSFDNPLRVRTWEEMTGWIEQIGLLPLFKNEVPGFSVWRSTPPAPTGGPVIRRWTPGCGGN